MPTKTRTRAATERRSGTGVRNREAMSVRAAARVSVQRGQGIQAIRVPGPTRLRRWALAAAPARADITLRVVGAGEGRRLNREYRGRDYATNVLSFPYGRIAGVLAGDVVLCAPVIAREARDQGKPLDAHFAHLVIHGVLHVRGYVHEAEHEAARMEGLERALLRRLGYPDPYA